MAVLWVPGAARAEWPRELLAGGADSQTVRTVDLGELMWFKNQGGWALSERRILAADVVDAALIRPADIDGDGAVDLVPG